MSVGRRIAYVRGSLGISQRELADLVGVRLWRIDQWERDERDLPRDQLEALARVTGASPNWLLTGSGPAKSVGERSGPATGRSRIGAANFEPGAEIAEDTAAAVAPKQETPETKDPVVATERMSEAALRAARLAADALIAQATRQARAILEDALREREQAAAEHARAREIRRALEQAR